MTFELFPEKLRRQVIQDCYEDVYFARHNILTQVFRELLEEYDKKYGKP
jgi:hypothetical protein